MKVFVCDGRSRAALQVCRSLNKAGHEVHVGESFHCSSFYSNSIKKKVIYPNPDHLQKAFFNYLISYVKSNNISFIYPFL